MLALVVAASGANVFSMTEVGRQEEVPPGDDALLAAFGLQVADAERQAADELTAVLARVVIPNGNEKARVLITLRKRSAKRRKHMRSR